MSGEVTHKKLVGSAIRRKEDPDILLGEARYTQDVTLPGMLYAAILRSPYAHARIRSINLARALALPGVVGGVTGAQLKEIPYLKPLAPFPFQSRDPFQKGNPTIKFFDHYCLATDKARFVGEPVAAVVATNRYIAEDALEMIDAEFDALPALVDTEAALAPNAPRLYEEWDDNIMLTFRVSGGDVERAFREADVVIKEEIRSGRFTGTPIETRAVVASYEANTKTLTVWDTTQIPHPMSTLIENTITLPQLKIRVVAPRIGGGYGQKWSFYAEKFSSRYCPY